MRVAVVGAGALGSVYAARLACIGGCDVEVVARSPTPPGVTRLERVDGAERETFTWSAPARTVRAPASRQARVWLGSPSARVAGGGSARSRRDTRSAEALAYVEEHFGRKLHAQNIAMGARIVELARERGVGVDALEELLGQL
jgi:hypothetical protein